MKTWMHTVLGWLLLVVAIAASAAPGDKVTYYHNDPSGTPIAATDEQGKVIWRESYEPYGRERGNAAPSSTQPLSYTGKPYDDETGLAYFGARYYDPQIGRFLGMDPVEFDPSNLHSFNKYAYGNNNPYRYLDPDGNSPLEWVYLVGDATSLVRNVATANWGGAAMDMVSIVVDAAGPPGGRTALSLWRAGDKALDATKQLDRATDAAKSTGRAKNKLTPDPQATGSHSTYKSGPDGKTSNYATYEPNPRNPSGFDEVKRVDVTGRSHRNPDGTVVPTPHVSEAGARGVRPARSEELP